MKFSVFGLEITIERIKPLIKPPERPAQDYDLVEFAKGCRVVSEQPFKTEQYTEFKSRFQKELYHQRWHDRMRQ